MTSQTALMAVLEVNPAFEAERSQLSHGSRNIWAFTFLALIHTQACLTSNQIKFVGVCHDFNFQGNINEVPRNKTWCFKCVCMLVC